MIWGLDSREWALTGGLVYVSMYMYNAGKLRSKEGSKVNLKKEWAVENPVLFRGESQSQNVVSECRKMAQLSVLFVRVKH